MVFNRDYKGFEYDERPVNLINYIPPIFADTHEEQAIQACVTYEFEQLYEQIKNFSNGNFIWEADGEYLKKWEKMLNISPPTSDTLYNRRFRIYTLWNSSACYTEQSLRTLLSELVGKDYYDLIIDYPNYKISISIALNSSVDLVSLEKSIGEIIPANMLLEINYLYTRYNMLIDETHDELSIYTHEQIRTEVDDFE